MGYVLRTWHCLNPECAATFDAGEPNPPCPSCGCVRVSWVPGGGNVLHGSTRNADATLRRIAASYNLTNLRSARHGEAAHPGRGPAPRTVGNGQPMNVGLGLGVRMTENPYSEFQGMNKPLVGHVPIGGRYKRKSKLPPREVRFSHRDDRR